MKLKLDENLGERGALALGDAGHEVCTVQEQNLQGARDPDLLAQCVREGRALVTFDLDFSNPLVYPPEHHEGVAVIRLPRKPGRHDIERALETLIKALRSQSLAKHLWIVEDSRIRVYSPRP